MNAGALDARRIARTLSAVENRAPEAAQILRAAYRAARHTPVVGVTGPPGAGKSTLVDGLAVHWAERGQNVAVLAIDPSSPYSGGALLGDRVRMDRAASHPRVFVRSLASRGETGGLAAAAHDVVIALGALGFDRIVLETVGAGQSDVAVANLGDAVIVVTVPDAGDQVQAAKAGILEIGDVYVVNKSDLPGSANAVAHLVGSLDLIYPGSPGSNSASTEQARTSGHPERQRRHGTPVDRHGYWRPPVLSACAAAGAGVAQLAAAADDFLAWSRETGRQRNRLHERVRTLIAEAARERLLSLCLETASEHGIDLDALSQAVARGAVDVPEAADRLVAQLIR